MKTWTLTFANAGTHRPAHPERTAYRHTGADVEFREWPSPGALATALRMQSRRAPHRLDWHAWAESNMAARQEHKDQEHKERP